MTRDTFAAKGEPLPNDGPITPDPQGDDPSDYVMERDATAWIRVGDSQQGAILHISTHRERVKVEVFAADDEFLDNPLSIANVPA